MSIHLLASGWLLGVALVAAASGCSEDEEPSPPRPMPQRDAAADGGTPAQHWVGDVENTDIRLGIVGDPTRLRLFFCGGPETWRTDTRWLIVDVEEAGGSFEYEESGWRVRGEFEDEVVVGQLERDGSRRGSFRAEPTNKRTLAGLYEGDSQCGRIGFIVTQLDLEEEPTAQGACLGAGLPQQVNPILPIAEVNGRIRVKIGETEALVREAAPPIR